jgi:hypothetical protein
MLGSLRTAYRRSEIFLKILERNVINSPKSDIISGGKVVNRCPGSRNLFCRCFRNLGAYGQCIGGVKYKILERNIINSQKFDIIGSGEWW